MLAFEFDKRPFINNKRYEHAPHLHVPSHGEKVWPCSADRYERGKAPASAYRTIAYSTRKKTNICTVQYVPN
jgi:hypothetical protein